MTGKKKLTLLISDLHLDPERLDITEAFLSFLSNTAIEAEALYILGDFFNVWIGDDNVSELNQLIASSLNQLANTRTRIYLMHGNRDFLLGEKFARACHASLISEPYLLECYGNRHLLMHGDSLCTRDEDYIQFRNMVRDTHWQEKFLAQTLEQRQTFANQARAQSKAMSSNKAEDIMDVTPAEVVNVMEDSAVLSLIHGHTHRPAVHSLQLSDNTKGQRAVLGDWDKGISYIKLSNSGLQLIHPH
jgi:UDP-2,3-diacylglucosamine hydrolase